jgi:hypothetical protein
MTHPPETMSTSRFVGNDQEGRSRAERLPYGPPRALDGERVELIFRNVLKLRKPNPQPHIGQRADLPVVSRHERVEIGGGRHVESKLLHTTPVYAESPTVPRSEIQERRHACCALLLHSHHGSSSDCLSELPEPDRAALVEETSMLQDRVDLWRGIAISNEQVDGARRTWHAHIITEAAAATFAGPVGAEPCR